MKAMRALALAGCLLVHGALADGAPDDVDLGARPALLVEDLRDGPLKERLRACLSETPRRTAFSIGHRGLGVVYPEHTLEAYEAAFRMGSGALECDVTFTKDLALVCRHSQNDLATTTDILLTPLASTCIQPFTPARLLADGSVRRPARAECRTSELTLAEFKTLKGKIDAFDPSAQTVEEFVAPPRRARPEFGAGIERGTLLTHAESIELFKRLGVRMVPELKAPSVRLPFRGLTRELLAQRLVDEYRAAGVPPADVMPQSFDRRDVEYWIAHEPDFGARAVLLDSAPLPTGAPRARLLRRYKAAGINTWAPSLFMLLTLDSQGRIVPSRAARAARAAGLDILAWTLERPGNYYRTVDAAITREGDVFEVIDVLARDVGVRGIFSDWPATVSFYAGCTGLP